MRSISVIAVFLGLFLGITFVSVNAQSSKIPVPTVERWQEAPYPFGTSDMGHPTKIVVKWRKDPRGRGYEGSSVYYVQSGGTLVLFSKSWNFRKSSEDYYWSRSRTALKLDDGKWFVGEEGEMLRINRQRDGDNNIIAVEYQFTGKNNSVRRVIQLQ